MSEELQKTGRDCSVCEDGTLLHDGCHLLCDTCDYSPDYRPTLATDENPQEAFRREVDERAYGDVDGRPRLVGGWPDAYWGSGEYCFHPESGFHSPL